MVFGYLIFVIWLGKKVKKIEKNCDWKFASLLLAGSHRAQLATTTTMLYSLETLKTHLHGKWQKKNYTNLTALDTIS